MLRVVHTFHFVFSVQYVVGAVFIGRNYSAFGYVLLNKCRNSIFFLRFGNRCYSLVPTHFFIFVTLTSNKDSALLRVLVRSQATINAILRACMAVYTSSINLNFGVKLCGFCVHKRFAHLVMPIQSSHVMNV